MLSTASRLQDELDDLRDEVTYLKVKLRKEGNISRSDYTDVREPGCRTLRSRAHGRIAGTQSSDPVTSSSTASSIAVAAQFGAAATSMTSV